MNKDERNKAIINALNEKFENQIIFEGKDGQKVLEALSEIIIDAMVRGDTFKIPNVGTFDTRIYKGAKIHNVLSGEFMDVGPKIIPKITFLKQLRERLGAEEL